MKCEASEITFSQHEGDVVLSIKCPLILHSLPFVRRASPPESGRHEHHPVWTLAFHGLLQEEHTETGRPSQRSVWESLMPGSTSSLPNRIPQPLRWLGELELNTVTIPSKRDITNFSPLLFRLVAYCPNPRSVHVLHCWNLPMSRREFSFLFPWRTPLPCSLAVIGTDLWHA